MPSIHGRTHHAARREREALKQYVEATRAREFTRQLGWGPDVSQKQVDQIGGRAIDAFVRRDATTAEISTLRTDAQRLMRSDLSDEQIVNRLRDRLDGTPEAQAMNQVVGANSALLGHERSDPRWIADARQMALEGKSPAEIRAATEASIKAGDEYRFNHMGDTVDAAWVSTVGHVPDETPRLADIAKVRGMIKDKVSVEEVDRRLTDELKAGDEYRKLHIDDVVNQSYQTMLGRAPDPATDELERSRTWGRQLIDEKKTPDEVNNAFAFVLSLSPEYQERQDQLRRGDIVERAQREVGTLEATGNNDGDVAKYPGHFGRGAQSYCANFASYILDTAGIPTDFYNTDTMKQSYIEQGKWKGLENPKPGDLVWFNWDGGKGGPTDHVGIVKAVNPDGTIRTIEGNTGGPEGEGVWEQDRSMDVINGFANP